ncbi:MAG: hypothetical protein ACRESI_01195 [Gammaproteobacteria bacterium]
MTDKPPPQDNTGTPPKRTRGKSQAQAPDSAKPKPAPKRRKFHLTSLRSVRRELGVLYWEARNKEIPLENAAKLTYILTSIAKVLVDSDLEKRVDKLERTT